MGQLRMTDIYSNSRPYWTVLAEVTKIQFCASIKSERFTDFLRHVSHQYSLSSMAVLYCFSVLKGPDQVC